MPLARIASKTGDNAAAQAINLSHIDTWDIPSIKVDSEQQENISKDRHIIEAAIAEEWKRVQAWSKDRAGLDWIDFYNCDHLGTPRELTDDSGRIVWGARYRAWGTLSRIEENYRHQNIRFQGQYEDIETGLFYNRYRYYDAIDSRYISQDPIGLLGGLNCYTYSSSPTLWVDPLGLTPKCPKNSPCNPCTGKNPALEAMAMQGTSTYPNNPYAFVDAYTNMVLKDHLYFYCSLLVGWCCSAPCRASNASCRISAGIVSTGSSPPTRPPDARI